MRQRVTGIVRVDGGFLKNAKTSIYVRRFVPASDDGATVSQSNSLDGKI
jgi:hypothetical protein